MEPVVRPPYEALWAGLSDDLALGRTPKRRPPRRFRVAPGTRERSIADIKNVGEGRWGGAITAAKLLEQFVGDVPWTHLDIAGPAFTEGAKPWQDGGGTGAFVTALIRLAEVWQGQTSGKGK